MLLLKSLLIGSGGGPRWAKASFDRHGIPLGGELDTHQGRAVGVGVVAESDGDCGEGGGADLPLQLLSAAACGLMMS